MLDTFEIFPKIDDVVVVLEVEIGFGVLDIFVDHHLCHACKQRRGHSFKPVFGQNADQPEIEGFGVSDRFKKLGESRRA